MSDEGEDWLEWQARFLERFCGVADFLTFQLSIGEKLLEGIQIWADPSEVEAQIIPNKKSEARRPVKEAPQSLPLLSPSEPREVGMRNIEDIILDAQKTLGQSFREAFDAGRNHVASELKAKMAALFENLAGSEGGSTGAEPSHSAPHEGQHTNHGQG